MLDVEAPMVVHSVIIKHNHVSYQYVLALLRGRVGGLEDLEDVERVGLGGRRWGAVHRRL